MIEERVCLICKKKFQRHHWYKTETCSKKCGYELIKKRKYKPWNIGLNKKNDKRLKKMSKDRKGKNNVAKRPEVREKIRKNMLEQYRTGKRNRFKTTMKANEARRKGDTYQNFRRRVFNFYPNVCVLCKSIKNLEAHHIILQEYERRRSTGKGDHRIRNGIILCKSCHNKIHKDNPKNLNKQGR